MNALYQPESRIRRHIKEFLPTIHERQELQKVTAAMCETTEIKIEWGRAGRFVPEKKTIILPDLGNHPDLEAVRLIHAILDHENAHARWTTGSPPSGHGELFERLAQLLEDVRVERLSMATWPGTRKSLEYGRDQFLRRIATETAWNTIGDVQRLAFCVWGAVAPEMRVMLDIGARFGDDGMVVAALSANKKCQGTERLGWARKTGEVIALAKDLADVLKSKQNGFSQIQEHDDSSENENDESEEQNGGESDEGEENNEKQENEQGGENKETDQTENENDGENSDEEENNEDQGEDGSTGESKEENEAGESGDENESDGNEENENACNDDSECSKQNEDEENNGETSDENGGESLEAATETDVRDDYTSALMEALNEHVGGNQDENSDESDAEESGEEFDVAGMADSWVVDPSCASMDKTEIPEITELSRVKFSAIEAAVEAHTRNVASALQAKLDGITMRKWEGGKRAGKKITLGGMVRHVTSNAVDVFSVRAQSEVKLRGIAIELTMDLSSSMQGRKLGLAKQSVVVMGETLARYNIPFSVSGWKGAHIMARKNAYGNRQTTPVVWSQIKCFNEAWADRKAAIESAEALGCTPMADSVLKAIKSVYGYAVNHGKTPYLWIYTDGEPMLQGKDAGQPYHAAYLRFLLAAARAAKINVTIFGIETSYVMKYADVANVVVVGKVENLSDAIVKQMSKTIV